MEAVPDTTEALALQHDNAGKYVIHHILENPEYPDKLILDFLNHPKVAPTLLTPDKIGHKPLNYALRHLRPAVVEALVSNGADLLDPDPRGCVALHHVARQWLSTVRQDPHSDVRSPWLRGTREHPRDYLEQCMKLWNAYIELAGGQESINVRDSGGNTPLMSYLGSDDKGPSSWLPESA